MSSKNIVTKKNFFKRMCLRLFRSSTKHQENMDLETIGSSKVAIEPTSDYVGLKDESSVQVQLENENENMTVPVGPTVADQAEVVIGDSNVVIEPTSDHVGLKVELSSIQSSTGQTELNLVNDPKFDKDDVKKGSVQIQFANENRDMTIPVDMAVFSSAENMPSKKTVAKKNFFKRMRLRLFGSSTNRQQNVDLETIGDSNVVIESTSDFVSLKDESTSVQFQLANENQDMAVGPVGPIVADQVEIVIGNSKFFVESTSNYVDLKDESLSIQNSSSQTEFDLVKDPKFEQNEVEKGTVQVQLANENQDMAVPVGPIVADQVEIAIGDSKVVIESKSDYIGLKDESSSNKSSSGQTEFNLVNDPKFDQNEVEKGSVQAQLENEN